MKSASEAFQGCLRDVELDGRVIGLPEVLDTTDIRPGCVWDFPCVEAPCGPGEVCSQDGHTGFRCSCSQPPCHTPDTSSPAPSAQTPGEGRHLMISQLNKYDSRGRG